MDRGYDTKKYLDHIFFLQETEIDFLASDLHFLFWEKLIVNPDNNCTEPVSLSLIEEWWICINQAESQH